MDTNKVDDLLFYVDIINKEMDLMKILVCYAKPFQSTIGEAWHANYSVHYYIVT